MSDAQEEVADAELVDDHLPALVPPAQPARACLSEKNACAMTATELRDAIGHDPEGHRIARRLVEFGIVTREQAWAMTISDLFDIRGMGEAALKVLQDRKVMRPDAPWAGTAGHLERGSI